MKYMGSKLRIAKYILPLILQDRLPGQYYVEPFCGGCNLLDKVPGNRIAGDINKYLIALWQGLQQDLPKPGNISKVMYGRAMHDFRKGSNESFSDFEIGWIGWMASFNGRFFDGGYSGCSGGRNYIHEQIRNTEKQTDALKNVRFFACDYAELPISGNSIIYCDIPYRNTTQYYISRRFDYDRFWNWCFTKKAEGHTVFVSEQQAPEGVECIWSMERVNSLHTTKTHIMTEKLFKI